MSPRKRSQRNKATSASVDVVPAAVPTTAFQLAASSAAVSSSSVLAFSLVSPASVSTPVYWRVTKVAIDVCSATPCLVKVQIFNGSGVILESRLIIVSPDIRTIVFRNSKVTDRAETTSSPTTVAQVTVVGEGTATVSGTCFGSYRL